MIQRAYQKVCQLTQDTKLFAYLEQDRLSLRVLIQVSKSEYLQYDTKITQLSKYDKLNQFCQGNFKTLIQFLKKAKNIKFNHQDLTLVIQTAQDEQTTKIKFSKPQTINRYLKNTSNCSKAPKSPDPNRFPVQIIQQSNKSNMMNIRFQQPQKYKTPPQIFQTPKQSLKRHQRKKKLKKEDKKKFIVLTRSQYRKLKSKSLSSRPTTTTLQYLTSSSEKSKSSQHSDKKQSEITSKRRLIQEYIRFPATKFLNPNFQEQCDIKVGANVITSESVKDIWVGGKENVKYLMLRFSQIGKQVYVGFINLDNRNQKFIYGSNGRFYYKVGKEQYEEFIGGFEAGQKVKMSLRKGKITWKVENVFRRSIRMNQLNQQCQICDRKWIPAIYFGSRGDSVQIFE